MQQLFHHLSFSLHKKPLDFHHPHIIAPANTMYEPILVTHKVNGSKYSTLLIYVSISIFITAAKFAVSQPSAATQCILEFKKNLSCETGDWGGFLNKNFCCGGLFQGYLYALGDRANQTGKIYLNREEQRSCLSSLEVETTDVSGCGIEKLTGGGGGCSDFSVDDVLSRLGDGFRSMKENCAFGNIDKELNHGSCRSCVRCWENMEGIPTSNDVSSMEVETDVCRFAVLVSLTSTRIKDEVWIENVYKCLGEQINNKGKQLDGNKVEAEEATSDKKITKGLGVLIGGGIGLGIVVAIALLILTRRFCKSNASANKKCENLVLPKESSDLKIPIKEVYIATNNMKESNFIGEGTAGKVYKGILSDNRHVAIKHIINDGHIETFVREVRSLSHVRHPNLVALLGHCENEDECFLVYELCPNGNLSEWLFGKEKVLTWIQRLEIAVDCARGLWFLHTYPEGCIVHRDIKPTNILLGMHFEAKLSDFGLSKVIDIGETYVSSEVRGTFGYVDPEYQNNRQVNPAGDVYSFGIVLLQILSGRRVINMNMKTPKSLSKMAKSLTGDGSIAGFADSKLDGEYSEEAFDITFKLALSCTALIQERPPMEKVVAKLEEALNISTKAIPPAPPTTPDQFSTP